MIDVSVPAAYTFCMQIKNCAHCKKEFTITDDHQSFYQKIGVPEPSWCPRCRLIRRIMHANVWSVYWRNCDKCGANTLSMFSKDKKVTVFCPKCWWADDWDGTEYAKEYDPSRPFLEQLRELVYGTPWVSQETIGPTMIRSEYCNGASYLKNCYLTFWADYSQDVAYSSLIFQLKDSLDCLRANESELCYESIGIAKCYKTFFSEECESCSEVWFSRNCYNTINCAGCVNLRGASYCILNVQYSKEEYFEKLKEMRLDTRDGLRAFQKQVQELWNKSPRREYTGNTMNVLTTGEYVFNSKNAKEMFLATGVEDSAYCQFVTVAPAKDCMDYSGWGANASLMYEATSTGENASNVKFSHCCYPNSNDVEYSIWASSSKNCFGCVNLKRKSYCILNKEYTKEAYFALVEKIKKEMDTNPYIDEQGRIWKYGEFLPPELSLFGYNESNAMRYFPKTKEQATKEGLPWYDKEEPSHIATIDGRDLPGAIHKTDESILTEVIACTTCDKKYKIARIEFEFLQKTGLPVPPCCPKCRENRRFETMNPPLALRDADCDSCEKAILTSYDKGTPNPIYCTSCYQQLFV